MEITIEVKSETEAQLQEEADIIGLPVQDRFYVVSTLPLTAWEALILSMGVPGNILSDAATQRETIYED